MQSENPPQVIDSRKKFTHANESKSARALALAWARERAQQLAQSCGVAGWSGARAGAQEGLRNPPYRTPFKMRE
jgi:hypothetical protein